MSSALIQPVHWSDYLTIEGRSPVYRIGNVEKQDSLAPISHELENPVIATPKKFFSQKPP
ncbi:MAG: hypothetical protein KFF73_13885 [Cyclobacteriaceae bacterium]|nr:hypothetical protein [Cyclobacteriaceae bacterium]